MPLQLFEHFRRHTVGLPLPDRTLLFQTRKTLRFFRRMSSFRRFLRYISWTTGIRGPGAIELNRVPDAKPEGTSVTVAIPEENPGAEAVNCEEPVPASALA